MPGNNDNNKKLKSEKKNQANLNRHRHRTTTQSLSWPGQIHTAHIISISKLKANVYYENEERLAAKTKTEKC